jgi:peptide/nickel transport system substrate-binding protein
MFLRMFAVLSVFLGATANAVAQDAPQPGGTLTFGVIGEPQNYDCHAQLSFAAIHYLAPHYALLVKFDQRNFPEVVGDAAERWEVSDDGRTYRFTLRAGIRFHDGTALTSTDVKATFDRLRTPPAGVTSLRRTDFDAIEAIGTPDPRTVVFMLSRAQPYFPALLANPFNCIYSADLLARDPTYPTRRVMGAGPFRFVEHQRGSHWEGRRFEGYHLAQRPLLDGFKAAVLANTGGAITALQGGQIMAEFRGVAPPLRDRLTQTMGERVAIQEGVWALSLVIAFNAEKPPFDDARVRRALSLAIDRWGAQALLSRTVSLRLVGGTQRPGSPFAASDAELAGFVGYGRDPAAARAEARRLLREAGHENLRFTLVNRNISDPYTAVGIYLIDQWRQIGVTVEQSAMEVNAYTQALNTGNYQAIVDFSNAMIDDPEVELRKYLSRDRSAANSGRYVDRELDALYDRLPGTVNGSSRRDLTRQFEKLLFDRAYMFPFMWFQRITAMSSAVKGWVITPSHLVNQDLTDVWLAR